MQNHFGESFPIRASLEELATIQQHYEKVSLPFQDLIIDGDQVKQDIRVSDLMDFLHNI